MEFWSLAQLGNNCIFQENEDPARNSTISNLSTYRSKKWHHFYERQAGSHL